MSQSKVLIERLDQLIPMKTTGSKQDLSERPGISRITVCELIEFMKAMEAENEYCPHQSSFYYAEDKILAKGFVNKRKIGGGVIFLRLFCFVRFFRTNSKYL